MCTGARSAPCIQKNGGVRPSKAGTTGRSMLASRLSKGTEPIHVLCKSNMCSLPLSHISSSYCGFLPPVQVCLCAPLASSAHMHTCSVSAASLPCSGLGYEPQPPQLHAFSPSTGVAHTFQITVICEFHRWLFSSAPPCSLTGGSARCSLAIIAGKTEPGCYEL